MSEWRTEAQIQADEALHRAIQGVLDAYSPAEGFVLHEFVVITSRVGIQDDNSDKTRYDYALANGSIPYHHMIGLVSWAEDTMREDRSEVDE